MRESLGENTPAGLDSGRSKTWRLIKIWKWNFLKIAIPSLCMFRVCENKHSSRKKVCTSWLPRKSSKPTKKVFLQYGRYGFYERNIRGVLPRATIAELMQRKRTSTLLEPE
ncbi:hypothetical protein AVEN_237760-1 [Araneus ventricosus]|uniref:Uncharacterized protein n=1 Tax=Araneus ventricosus TaxID=182803 RepID=A0A4Y2MUH4_ARAVE|nr:hypothetical protein AVEN_237760-1 [Araneus ventricosus]